ncbi:MAG: hypothetical protein OQK78_12535 [Gammaproteobacteria bacterium]|nr:hypothetical protein [Gammaproteobacteria bacterium]
MEQIKYRYDFTFKDGRSESFTVVLDGSTLDPVEPLPQKLPEWTRLHFERCRNCSLDPLDHSYCPLAGRLEPVLSKMINVLSHENVDVEVTLDERSITRSCTAQEGLSALMGIITATSGCPNTSFFKPMARFHLPFANTEETFYRATSMYMLGQYYRWHNDKGFDMDMKGLLKFYEGISQVNRGMSNRIKAEQREDGAINALVLLDMFAMTIPESMDEILDSMEPLFEPYINAERVL